MARCVCTSHGAVPIERLRPVTARRPGHSGLLVAMLLLASPAAAGHFAAPGDLRLRHDLELLGDAGLITVPLTSWPLGWHDISAALAAVDPLPLGAAELAAYGRLKRAARTALSHGELRPAATASLAAEPRRVRAFEDAPRDEAQASAGLSWASGRFALRLRATLVADAGDGDELRADGSYLALHAGNWVLTTGWQERWWGPGRDGSLILSNNARPLPAIALQRRRSHGFESRWLRWIGPWTLTAFVGRLDDTRSVDDANLFGLRAAFKPLPGLEIGLSRAAQWCGDGRPCDAAAFADMLLGNDNRGVNVSADDEPGNQLGGIDLRWAPRGAPAAVYAQWIGEDTRRGGPEIGSWLRLAGIEYRGASGATAYRMHLEVAETSCRDGGLGFSGLVADCAYEHSLYRSGYRYRGRPLGHGIDGDGLSFSFGATLVQSAGHAWSVLLRRMDVNRAGQPDVRHSLSPLPQDRLDAQVSHQRSFAAGTVRAGIGYRRIDGGPAAAGDSDVTGFIQWSTQ